MPELYVNIELFSYIVILHRSCEIDQHKGSDTELGNAGAGGWYIWKMSTSKRLAEGIISEHEIDGGFRCSDTQDKCRQENKWVAKGELGRGRSDEL